MFQHIYPPYTTEKQLDTHGGEVVDDILDFIATEEDADCAHAPRNCGVLDVPKLIKIIVYLLYANMILHDSEMAVITLMSCLEFGSDFLHCQVLMVRACTPYGNFLLYRPPDRSETLKMAFYIGTSPLSRGERRPLIWPHQ